MIKIRQKGDFSKTIKFMNGSRDAIKKFNIDKYGREGVAALSSATPVDTGRTSQSWYYKVERTKDSIRLSFHNTNIQNGVPIAIILQYGHGTRNGGWVEGRDYINPAIQPVFDKISQDAWKEVVRQ